MIAPAEIVRKAFAGTLPALLRVVSIPSAETMLTALAASAITPSATCHHALPVVCLGIRVRSTRIVAAKIAQRPGSVLDLVAVPSVQTILLAATLPIVPAIIAPAHPARHRFALRIARMERCAVHMSPV